MIIFSPEELKKLTPFLYPQQSFFLFILFLLGCSGCVGVGVFVPHTHLNLCSPSLVISGYSKCTGAVKIQKIFNSLFPLSQQQNPGRKWLFLISCRSLRQVFENHFVKSNWLTQVLLTFNHINGHLELFVGCLWEHQK